MNMSIYFPHLGIHLEHVGKTVQVLGIDIAYYGIVLAVSMILGVGLVLREAKRTGQDEDFYLNMLILSIVIGVVGARAYYVFFSWENYRDNLWEILNTRNGGLAIYGGILFGVTTACVYSKKKKVPLGRMADTACLGLLLGQILGRWGNFFNREAFGGYTDNLLAMRLPVNAVRSNEITAQMWVHVQNIQGTDYIQVHPTFLYESLWNVFLLVFLLWIRRRKKFSGEVFCCYLIGYGVGRCWIESLRTDQLKFSVGGWQFPVSQAISLLLAAGASLAVLAKKLRRDGRPGGAQSGEKNNGKGEETAAAPKD